MENARVMGQMSLETEPVPKDEWVKPELKALGMDQTNHGMTTGSDALSASS